MTYLKTFADQFATGHGIAADEFVAEVKARPEAQPSPYAYATGAMMARYDHLRMLFGYLLAEYRTVCRKADALERANDRVLDDKTADHVAAEAAEILALEVPTLEEVEAA